MTGVARVAVGCGCMLGESATWSEREQALYWIDIRAPALHRFDPASLHHRSWMLPELCGAVVPAREGVVLALRRDLMHFDPASAKLTPLCTIEPAALDNRLNEAKCDGQGRLWVGSMRDFAAATTGSLYRVDPGTLLPERVLTPVTIPNGLGWSPDGRTMFFSDTADGAIRAYEYGPNMGQPGKMRELVPGSVLPGRPDGCAVDALGHLWTTRFGAGCVIRVAPDGRAVARIDLPTSQPASCALGGPNLTTLFITTAKQRLPQDELTKQAEAGHLFAIEVEVPGLSDVEFNPECVRWNLSMETSRC